MSERDELDGVAVIGLAGRFPGAADAGEFWRNLRAGVESVRHFSDEELTRAGVDEELRRDPRYVPASAVLEDVDRFDAPFFGFSPREAAVLDPQHRLFMECAWEALEDAGRDPKRSGGATGVYAGCYAGNYLLLHLASHPALMRSLGSLNLRLLNDKDFLPARVAHQLDLKGPAIGVQTACSSSLVALHLASRSLITYECDVALAGGVALPVLEPSGYLYEEGGVLAPDGHCRPFDARGGGTVPGCGVGVVVLRRLEDAVADGDRVRAVVRGTAVNNDGAVKVGFTAPSADAQAEVIATALGFAEVDPATIGYVEAHGTGTALGDPIEVEALSRAFGNASGRGSCGLGSVKSNIGHLDAAAGIAGVIKTVLALEHGEIPPSLHYETPNPGLELERTPFRVVGELQTWERGGAPRRAGVSSFGMGGTNAHAVLEEAPRAQPSGPSRDLQLLPVSARTAAAADRAAERLAAHLEGGAGEPLADVAYTLSVGRHPFRHRRFVVAGDATTAAGRLRGGPAAGRAEGVAADSPPPVAFLFPGQGSQYPGMARRLYEGEPRFRDELDRSLELLADHLDADLRGLLFPPVEEEETAADRLRRTEIAQPALFAVEVALGRLWTAWGVTPAVMAGHSVGEYAAACLAGVFSLENGCALVAARGRLIAAMPPGAMLGIALPEERLAALASETRDVAVAALNGPRLGVLSGPTEVIEALHRRLAADGVECTPLHTSHAFHSPMMEPAVERFAAEVARYDLSPPRLPIVSSASGRRLGDEEATDPQYWARHLRRTVRFADAAATLLELPGAVLLEVGPGRTLTSLVRRNGAGDGDGNALRTATSLPHPRRPGDAREHLLSALGLLWTAGVEPDWKAFFAGERRRRAALPTYPFERRRYWVRPAPAAGGETAESADEALDLPAPEGDGEAAGAATAGDGPAAAVTAIWHELLGVSDVGPHDDFFALGGHSLLATQVVSRLRDVYNVTVTLEDLFAHATPAALAARIAELQTAALPELPALAPRSGDGPAPLSFAQRRLWFLHRLNPDDGSYNLGMAVRVEGPLDAGRLAFALRAVARRQESLRTSFRETADGGAAQHVLDALPAMPLVDLTALPEGRRRQLARALATSAVAVPFDLAAAPPVRFRLLRPADGEHLLAMCLHHTVSDAWSHNLLLRELAETYRATGAGDAARLPDLPVQYADFAVWQRGWLRGEELERQLAYWRRRLDGAPQVLDLPTDRPRPPVRDGRGAVLEVILPPAETDELRRLAAERSATPFMALLALFRALLARYSGQRDLVVGTVVANRTRSELEPLIGFFANTLALRGDLGGAPGVGELVERARDEAVAAFDHQDLPFERLVENLNVPRSLAHGPLFQVLLTLQNLPRTGVSAADLLFEPLFLDAGTARFDLSLDLAPDGDRLVGALGYATALFDRTTVERMWRHFRQLVTAAAARPQHRFDDLRLLTAAERRQVLGEWNDTAVAVPRRPIHELILETAERRGGSTAVVGEGGALTYAELTAWTRTLAGRLRAAGVGRGSLVGLLLERDVEAVVALLAVLAAGGAYVPLDPAYPQQRLSLMVEDSGLRTLVTRPGVGSLEIPAGVTVFDPAAGGRAPAGELPAVDGDDLAYVIYTSGSTGRPKGVQIPHGALVNFLTSMARRPGMEVGEVLLSVTTLSFDIACLELLLPLLVGATVVVAPRRVAEDGARLAAVLEEHGSDLMQATPATWRMLLDAGWTPPPSLRVLCGGEAMPPTLAAALTAGGGAVWNLYGPTETTVWSSVERVTAGGGPVSIGRPIANTALHVLDSRLHPAPPTVPGEVCLGGAGLARGYLGHPARTAERFVPDPFATEPGARLYRTGDLARRRGDGSVEFLGRLDHQVKVRGFRIELGEVEAVLSRHPAVAACVVVPSGDAAERRLVAYLEAAADEAPEPAALRRHLGERLPPHMVPSVFVSLEALPLTPNGKVDRGALPEPSAVGGAEALTAPRNAVEAMVAGIWRQVLEVDEVGAESDFFALGGHSLLANRVVARLREAVGVEVPLRAFFEQPTVAGLAAVVERLGDGAAAAAPPLVPRRDDDPVPLSFAQERLWFLQQLDPASTAYNLPLALHLEGRLRPAFLAAALAAVVRRHEVLRTTFSGDGQPVQRVHPPSPVPLPGVDLSALPAARRRTAAQTVARSELQRPFDLAKGPPLRARLLHLAPAEHVLLVNMHHAVSDEWSLEVMSGELAALYTALAAGEPSPLPPLPVQYADYASWQRRWLSGEVLERQLAYWRRQLDGLPPLLDLPTDRPRSALRSEAGGRSSLPVPPSLTAGLEALARRTGTSLFMALLASFQALLGRFSGEVDFAVGTPVAGRDRVETEGMIGFLINTLVLRADLTAAPSFEELLGRVRDTSLDAHAHGELPFEKLVQELEPERSLSRTPLFQVAFVLQRAMLHDHRLPELRASAWELDVEVAKFDLALNVLQEEGRLRADLLYAEDLFDAATVERMGRSWLRLTGVLAEEPGMAVTAAPLLSVEERRHLLAAGERRRAAPAPARRLERRFADHAARRPEAVALSCGGDEMSYGELAAAASSLAARLRAAGVGRETRVGLCLERGLGMVVAILAVLEAGAAYLPLDPAHPPERLEFVLDDAGAPLVVAQRSLEERLPAAAGRRLWIDERGGAEGGPADVGPPVAPAPRMSVDDAAYVIYTSGSTGRPKGVMVSHRNVDRLMTVCADLFDYGSDDVWTLFHSYAFDFSVWELWGALAHGGRLVVVPRMIAVSPRETWELLMDEGVTVLNQTPSAFRGLVRAAGASRRGPGSLRTVVFGGEALELEALRPWFRRFGDRRPRLINMYGITETTVHVTHRPLATADLERPSRGSLIGGPLPDLDLHLLDRRMEPVAAGVAGEIHVGGAGVTRGYLGRPALTAERFVPHPHGAQRGERLYRSGDLARRCADGEIEYLGRIDHQVKVRGFRIELGEIESALLRHDGVREAVVLVRGGAGREDALVAWLVPDATANGGAGPDDAELRRHLGRELPEYMIPAAFVRLGRLPLTANGKLDRRALPNPAQAAAGADTSAAPRPPRSRVERLLTELFSEVLERPVVGLDDDFFALGGHSLLAVRLVARVREAVGVDLPVRRLFELPVVGDLARRLEEELRAGAARSLPPLRPSRPLPSPAPLSFAQEQLWFLHRLDPESALYNFSLPVRIGGRLSIPTLADALSDLRRRHESLRCRFLSADGRPELVVDPPTPVPLPVVDLSVLAPAERQRQVEELRRREARRPFDLAARPPLRQRLLRLGAEEHVGLFTLHHIVADDWSLGVLVRDLGEIYGAFAAGRPSPLQELEVQYADFAVWQRKALTGEALEERLAYWRRQLAGMPAELKLPRDESAAGTSGETGGRHGFVLPDELVEELGRLGREAGVSHFMILLANLMLLFHQASGQEDVVVGADVAGRDRVATEPLIGFFINLLVLRCDLSGDPTFRQLLERVRRVVLEAFAHGDLPFDRLVQDLRPQRTADRTPLVQAVLSYQNAPQPATRLGDLELAPLGGGELPVKRDLTLFFRQIDGSLHGAWAYDADRFTAATVARLACDYEDLLVVALADPDRQLEELRRDRRQRRRSSQKRRERRRARLQGLLEVE